MEGSPYTPGAGHAPAVLAGRDELLHGLDVRLNEMATSGRRRSYDVVFTGVRGVGKTAVLTAYAKAARQRGFDVITHQAVLNRPGFVEAILEHADRRIEQGNGAWTRARRALERVTGITLGVAGVSAGITFRDSATPDSPRVFPESLADALAALSGEIRKDVPRGGVALLVDEIQVAGPSDLTLLAATLHQLNVQHPDAVVAFGASGLPTVPADLRKAGVTHPDRLFNVEEIPPQLTMDEALYAVIEPARQSGVAWDPAAAELTVNAASRYPAHVQVFADEAWRAAVGPVEITIDDAEAGRVRAEDQLARRSLGPRVNELSGRKLEYLAAVAVNGGRCSAAILAATLDRNVTALSWLREELIRDGDIYSPTRGQIALAVPAFARYLQASYDAARELVDTELLTLEQLESNRVAAARQA